MCFYTDKERERESAQMNAEFESVVENYFRFVVVIILMHTNVNWMQATTLKKIRNN